MYRQNKEIFARALLTLDLLATVLSFLVAYQIKTHYFPSRLTTLYPLSSYLGLFLLILPLWALLLSRAQIYELASTEHPIWWVLRLAKYLAYGVVLVVLGLFVLRVQFVSRLLLLLFYGVNFLILVTAHALIHLVHRVQTNKNGPRVLIVGHPEKIRVFLENLARQKGVRVEIAAVYFLSEPSRKHHEGVSDHAGSHWLDILLPQAVQQIQSEEEIPFCIHEKFIDEILFAIRPEDVKKIEDILSMAEEEGIVTRVAADFFDLRLFRASWDELGTIPMITFSRTPNLPWQLLFKRVLDVVVAVLGLALTAPVMAIMALLVKRSSAGPIFFCQKRVGLRGATFTMVKFRTMVENAEALRRDLISANELTGPVFKIEGDPRVTAVGKLLRRYSLDELPQLYNVLLGNMSLVGPRPALPEEVAQYERWQRRRLCMKPGITGLWQVQGRGMTDFNDWVLLDLDYIDRWTLTLDLKILAMTFPQVLMGKGM